MRELTQGWRPQEGTERGIGGSPLSKSPWPPLMKLGGKDNIEAYLEAFECTVEAAKWPKEQWAFFIGLYISGEALSVLQALEKQEAGD